MSTYVQCGPSRGGSRHTHRYISLVGIGILKHETPTNHVASISDKDEVTSSILVSPTEVEAVNFLRRVFMVLGIAGIAAAILRVKGKSEISTRRGGWRQVNPPISE